MKIGDLVSVNHSGGNVRLVNLGSRQLNAGYVTDTEVCIVLDVEPPIASIWGRVKVLSPQGKVGWAEDGLFRVVVNIDDLKLSPPEDYSYIP